MMAKRSFVEEMYKPFNRFIIVGTLIVISIPLEVWGQSRQAIPLDELLQTALAQLPAKNSSGQLTASTWLSSPPSITVAYLAGSDSFTADETEVSVNLSINSASQMTINQQLESINRNILDNQYAQQKLYWSGLIREALWEIRISETKQKYLKLKQQHENN